MTKIESPLGDMSNGNDESIHSQRYRLHSTKDASKSNKCLKVLGCGDTKFTIYENTTSTEEDSITCCGISPNRMIIGFLHSIFRNSFLSFIVLACTVYLSLAFLFAAIIYGFGMKNAYCIGGVDFSSDRYVDAFLLSWTTLSTVGYGVIYGGISPAAEDIRNCTGITIMLTLESFVGLLFGSACGAILFVKVSRVQSFAQVIFSDVIVIRYGSGLQANEDEDTIEVHDDGEDEKNALPCPVLEFRIANKLNNILGGEIIDCGINLAASIDPLQASGITANLTRRRRRGKKGKRGPPKAAVKKVVKQEENDDDSDDSEDIEAANALSIAKLGLKDGQLIVDKTGTQVIHQDGNVANRVFIKVEPEAFDHPYFKRVWTIRHVLNADSPLINQHAREMIKRSDGFWPSELNNAAGVRASVDFDNLVVSFSGTSNADANSVYAQHVYDFGDVSVGYSFCNMLYRDTEDDSLFVDLSLINDVMEQNGGGAEPLEHAKPKTASMSNKVGTLTI